MLHLVPFYQNLGVWFSYQTPANFGVILSLLFLLPITVSISLYDCCTSFVNMSNHGKGTPRFDAAKAKAHNSTQST